ncbi:MAG TPA: FecR family protein [bacterium]|nr:FecR family protein [bacterium]
MNTKHLSNAELIAICRQEGEPSPETIEHLAACDECAARLEARLRNEPMLPASSDHDAAIDRIARISFDHLDEARPGLFAMLFTLPRLAVGAAAAALILIAAYVGIGAPATVEEEKIADADAPAPRIAPTLGATPRLFPVGTTIAHGRATILVKGPASLAADGAEELRLAKGTVEVSIEKGNDFRIHTADRYLVRVLGTRFTLDTDGTKLAVTVAEGLVEVIDGRTNDSIALSGGMAHTFTGETKEIATVAAKQPRAVRPAPGVDTAADEQPAATSFLRNGRDALKTQDATAAMDWFEKELAGGPEKDKALFEIVRLHERDGRFDDMLRVLKAHNDIVDGDTVFHEELLIKACKAEVKTGETTFPSCKKYLRVFPEGYKNGEIRELLENGDAR